MSSSLVDRTLVLFARAKKQGITNLQIFKDTELNPNWLSAFLNQKIPDPSVHRVQQLHDYLTEKVG